MGAIVWSAVPSSLQQYIKKNPEIKTAVFGAQFEDLKEYISVATEVQDKWVLGGILMNSIAQPGNKRTGGTSFHPTANAINQVPRIGQLRDCKADLQFDEQDIKKVYNSWIAEAQRLVQLGLYELPANYEQAIMDAIYAQIKKDIRRYALFKGVYNASGTAPVDMFDGINKIITDLITATTIPAGNVFTGATITSANVLAQVNGVTALVPEDMWGEDLVVTLSPKIWEMYNAAYIAANGTSPINPNIITEGLKKVDRKNMEFKPEIGLIGSDKIIVTLRNNIEIGLKNEGDLDNVVIETEKRDINMMFDWKMGVDINWPQFIYTNSLT